MEGDAPVDARGRPVPIPGQEELSAAATAGLLVLQGRLEGEFPDHRAMREERLAMLAGD
jgi:hypothetical protein